LASIGGNVAHANQDLVAQLIAAAIPLAVLAMLEGLKGDAGEVTRLTQAAGPNPSAKQADTPALSTQPTDTTTTTVHRVDTLAGRSADPARAVDGRQLSARPRHPDGNGVGARLAVAYRRGRPDGQPWTARTLAEAAGCGRSSAASFLRAHRQPPDPGP
jgi:hypothetical protein